MQAAPDHQAMSSALFDRVLLDPVGRGNDELRVLSGYSSPAMLTRHREELQKRFKRVVPIELLCGMTGIEGILQAAHLGFQELQGAHPLELAVSYVRPPHSVHSKLYVWSRNGVPTEAYLGSANYSQFGFGVTPSSRHHSELMQTTDPIAASRLWEEASARTIACDAIGVEGLIGVHQRPYDVRVVAHADPAEPRWGEPSVRLPLFIEATDRIHDKSGLNWGHRDNRNRNQAYIPVPKAHQWTDELPGFFPPSGQHFQVATSDGRGFVLVAAQANGKALQTPEDNAILGEYFRHRLGLSSGARVELEDLDRFGNRYVTFYRVDDDTYLMHFEPDEIDENQSR